MITTFLILIWLHLIADFFLQTDDMAIKKSSDNRWLTIHVLVYSLPFQIICGWKFALMNAAAHWVTDWITSRLTTYLWKKEKRHWFFVVIGIDQAIHLTILVLTIPFIVWII